MIGRPVTVAHRARLGSNLGMSTNTTALEDATRKELYALAKERGLEGRVVDADAADGGLGAIEARRRSRARRRASIVMPNRSDRPPDPGGIEPPGSRLETTGSPAQALRCRS